MSDPLLAGERQVLVARQHWSIVAPAIAGAAAITILGIVAVALIPETLAKRNVADVRRGVIGVIAVAGALSILIKVLQWRAARYVLTDRRVIVRRGVLSRFTESIALDRVQNTIVHQSIGARMIRCGDVEIESAGRDGTEVLHRIPDPGGFEAALMQAVEAHRGATPPPAGI